MMKQIGGEVAHATDHTLIMMCPAATNPLPGQIGLPACRFQTYRGLVYPYSLTKFQIFVIFKVSG
jgi:hypothetical protein